MKHGHMCFIHSFITLLGYILVNFQQILFELLTINLLLLIVDSMQQSSMFYYILNISTKTSVVRRAWGVKLNDLSDVTIVPLF